jgi:hypothetical protein
MIIYSIINEFQNKNKFNDFGYLGLYNLKKRKNKLLKFPYFNNFSQIKEKYSEIYYGDKFDNQNLYHYRFGFTGLTCSTKYIYAAAYNFILEINKRDFNLNRILSNKMMCDLHGIKYINNKIYYVLTGLDTLVEMDLYGKIQNTYTVNDDLKIEKNKKNLRKVDWRFFSKLFRGPTGLFHINFIEKASSQKTINLTSRNLNSIIEINLENLNSRLKPLHINSRLMIHDGKYIKSKTYFTSVDGKILESFNDSSEAKNDIRKDYKKIPNIIYKKFSHGMITKEYNIKDYIGREPSWCRGIEKIGDNFYTLIDGRRGSKNNYMKLLKINIKNNKTEILLNLDQKILNMKEKLSISTGFDLLYLK